MMTEVTEITTTTAAEQSNIHERAIDDEVTHGVDATREEKFTCKDCGERFARVEAARPGTPNPRTCAKCYTKNIAIGKAERKLEETARKKSGRRERYTFTLDDFTNIAIDTLAVGHDRSSVVEKAIVLMLANDPAAQAYVKHKASQSAQ